MSSFKKDEKVVCIDDLNQSTIVLKKGEIYTIKEVMEDRIFLYEVENGSKFRSSDFNYWGHKIHRFRKLDYAHTERICAEIIESLKVNEPQLN